MPNKSVENQYELFLLAKCIFINKTNFELLIFSSLCTKKIIHKRKIQTLFGRQFQNKQSGQNLLSKSRNRGMQPFIHSNKSNKKKIKNEREA